MAKLRIQNEPVTEYKKDRYLDQCIHRQNRRLKRILWAVSGILTTSIGYNIYFLFLR